MTIMTLVNYTTLPRGISNQVVGLQIPCLPEPKSIHNLYPYRNLIIAVIHRMRFCLWAHPHPPHIQSSTPLHRVQDPCRPPENPLFCGDLDLRMVYKTSSPSLNMEI